MKLYQHIIILLTLLAFLSFEEGAMTSDCHASPSALTHDFTGLPLTKEGWTDFLAMIQHKEHYLDSRVVYVSSSAGNDSTGVSYSLGDPTVGQDPFNPAGTVHPYATLTVAYAQIRDGFPDIMLLKNGDEWEEWFDIESIGRWSKSGRSQVERILLASYGEGARPTLNIGSNTGFVALYAQNLIVSGIRFFAHTWKTTETDRGIDIIANGAKNQLYEDCVLEWCVNRAQGGTEYFDHIAFRRCLFIEGNPGTVTPAIFALNGRGLLIEENLFYSPVLKRRHLYMSPAGDLESTTLRGVEIRRNIFFTSERTGLSIRSGGIIDNNLVVRNDFILVGGHGGSEDSIQSADVSNNVFLESCPANGDGEWGLALQNNDGTSVYNNILTDSTNLGDYNRALVIKGDEYVHVAKNIDIHHNIVHGRASAAGRGRPLYIYATLLDIKNVKIHDNDFQMLTGAESIITHLSSFIGFQYSNNRYFSTSAEADWFTPGGNFEGWVAASGETGAQAIAVSYPHPNRNLKTYNASLGGSPSTDEFMAEALKQSRGNWRPKYTACSVNNYIRKGFGKNQVDCSYTSPKISGMLLELLL